MPNNGTRRAPRSISYGNNSYYNKPRNNNNIWASKPVVRHESRTMKWKNGKRNEKKKEYGRNSNLYYYNLLTSPESYNRLPAVITEEKIRSQTDSRLKNLQEQFENGAYTPEEFNEYKQSILEDVEPNAIKQEIANSYKKRQNIIKRNTASHLKRRNNAQKISANFARIVANVELNNTNNNATYEKKIANAITKNFKTRYNNYNLKPYVELELRKMFPKEPKK